MWVAAAGGRGGRYRGRLIPVRRPQTGTRRERVTAMTTAMAAAFEDLLEDAPEQWWGVFFPIWPDLGRAAAGRAEAGRRTAADRHGGPAVTAEPDRRGRADLHIHTVASDGTASVVAILDHVAAAGDLDVIAITDHERIDAALAGRAIAPDRGLPFEVVVGEEVTTLGGHLLGAVPRAPRPCRSACAPRSPRSTTRVGSRSRPTRSSRYPLCAQGWVLRRLLDDRTTAVHPDALETFNPTSLGRPATGESRRFADAPRPARGRQQRRPRARGDRRSAGRRSRAAPRTDLRAAIARRRPRPTTGRSTGRSASSARSGSSCASAAATPATRSSAGSAATARGGTTAIRAAGPPTAVRAPADQRREDTAREDRPRLPVHLPGAGRGHPARPVPVREPAPARPRRPDHHRRPRPAALVRGRHHPAGRRLLGADQRVGRDAHLLAPLHLAGPRRCWSASGSTSSTSTSRSCRSCRCSCCASRRASTWRPSTPTPASRRPTSSAAGRCAGTRSGSTAGSRSPRPPATSSTASSRATTRSSPTAWMPSGSGGRADRALAGRDAEHPVRRAARAAQGPAGPAQGLPDPAQDRLRMPPAGRGLRAAGARGAPLRGHAPPPGRRVPRSRLRRREGPAVPDGRRLRLAGDRRRVVRDRPARGDGGRSADRCLGHPRLQGRRPPRARGPAGPAARAQGARRVDRAPAAGPRAGGRNVRGGPRPGGGVQLAAGDGQGGRLLRVRHPPAGRRGIAAAALYGRGPAVTAAAATTAPGPGPTTRDAG